MSDYGTNLELSARIMAGDATRADLNQYLHRMAKLKNHYQCYKGDCIALVENGPCVLEVQEAYDSMLPASKPHLITAIKEIYKANNFKPNGSLMDYSVEQLQNHLVKLQNGDYPWMVRNLNKEENMNENETEKPKKGRRESNIYRDEQIKKQYSEGKTVKELAEGFALSTARVHKICKGLNGGGNGNGNKTEKIERNNAIVTEFKAGNNPKALAEKFSLSEIRIRGILKSNGITFKKTQATA